MAQDTSLNGIRNTIVTQIYGRRLGLGPGNSSDATAHYLDGIAGVREQVEGWSSAGSTVTSTSVASFLSPYGVSVLGATAASGTTGYTLSAPVPGVRKTLLCITTGYAVVTLASGNFISTGSAASTYTIATFTGKGNVLDLVGLTTSQYGVLTNYAITTVTTGNTVSFT